jgi:hypothetical protein
MAMAEWARETQYQVSAKMWEASVKTNCWRNNFKLIQFIERGLTKKLTAHLY